jgi:hypothetical protein
VLLFVAYIAYSIILLAPPEALPVLAAFGKAGRAKLLSVIVTNSVEGLIHKLEDYSDI